MKPKYEEFTPEEIEDLDDTCAELAEENSVLQGRVDELREALEKLLLRAEVWAWRVYSEDHPDITAAKKVIAKNLE